MALITPSSRPSHAAYNGAVIGASAEARLGFDHQPLTEESVIDLGAFQLRVMTTPGHTPEHISFLLVEPDSKTPSALFSGGALIVGGAARTDLLTAELTRPLAQQLYHTMHEKLLNLPDSVDVFPTHGAGSSSAIALAPAASTAGGFSTRHGNPAPAAAAAPAT